jgi:hypothetical protein
MSKSALADLSQRLKGDSKEYRNKTINSQMHAVNVRATSIKKELRDEISHKDPELLKYLTDAELGTAASKFRATLMGIASNPARGLRALESDPNVLVSGTYGTFSVALEEASKAAIAYINVTLTKNKRDYVPLLNDKLIQLDHTRTVAETRITSDINAAGIDAVALVKQLKANKFISKKEYQEVFTNILNIDSYYRNGSKEFVVQGAVVEGELRSGKMNQIEGNKEVNPRTAAFRAAVEKAIQSNNWVEQAASDSYKDYVLKTLNNTAVKAKASGKLQIIDTKAAKVKTSEKTVTKRNTNMYSAFNFDKGKKPLTTMRNIDSYINARLPAAIRANMGEGTLFNRTGRFSESARITAISQTAQGFPSLSYTYQRSPYDVFDSTLGKAPWNTPGRDPKKLIEKSIRDIARDLAIGRFYLRRAQ